jgi:two-component system sensor histidine kinase/response regulator
MLANEISFSSPPVCLSILLAEDNPVSPTHVARMLEKLGHAVTTAATGRQSLSYVLEGSFDLVLMDVQMSDMESVTTAVAIREKEQVFGGHVPIIAMSDSTAQLDRKRCLAAGIDRYISKPRNVAELQTILLAFSDPDAIQRTTRPANWNRTEVMERAGGDEDALTGLVDIFVKDESNLLAEMNRALITQHAELLQQSTRKLGEELSYLGALELSQIARELAQLGQKKDFIRAGELALILQSRLSEMDAVMTGAEP